jgi:hypothetical protein
LAFPPLFVNLADKITHIILACPWGLDKQKRLEINKEADGTFAVFRNQNYPGVVGPEADRLIYSLFRSRRLDLHTAFSGTMNG